MANISFANVRESKNGQARHVPMDITVRELFCNYPRRSVTSLIFAGASGTRLTDIRVGFQNACARAGISDLHFHDLRHTFASQFMMAGGELYVLKEILGHKSINMTQRYSHLSPAYKVKAIDRMNTLWLRLGAVLHSSKTLPEPTPVTTASQLPSAATPRMAEIFIDAGLGASHQGAPADSTGTGS